MTTTYSELINRLDLRTKVGPPTGAATFTPAPEESIGLGAVRPSDGPTGVRGLKFTSGPKVTPFPNATLLASAWSEDTAYEVGRPLAEEAMAQQILVVLGPTINLHCSLLGGRLFEAHSEDPLLTGRLAAAYVLGLQDGGVGACLRHLIADESETDRNTVNSVVDGAMLREVYLLPFEIAIDESDACSLMAACKDVNGVPATEQHHVNDESERCTALAGFGDAIERPVAKLRSWGRVNAEDPVEVGAIEAGGWELGVGDRSFGYQLRVSGQGFGEETLAPPAQTSQAEVSGSDILEATVTLRSRDGEGGTLAGSVLFGVVAQTVPRELDQ